MAWTLVGLVALLLSLAYHLQLRLAGVVAIDSATALLNREIAGELSIGELQNVSFEKVVAEDIVLRDPQGRVVVRLARLAAWPDWGALTRGVIRVDHVRARDGDVTLYVSGPTDDTLSIAEAFQPARPRTGPPGNPPRVVVDGIVLDGVIVHGDVPGLEGLRVEDVRLTGGVRAQRDVRFLFYDGHAVMTGPYPGRTDIDHIEGFFDTNLAEEGLNVYARAHRGEDRVRARIELTRPDPDAAPIMDLGAQVEPLTLDTLADLTIVPSLEGNETRVRGHARLWGPTDDLQLRAVLHSEGGGVLVGGRLPREGPLVIDARTDRLRLDTIAPELPASPIGARVRLEIDEQDPAAPVRRVHAELDPVTIGDVAIPGFRLEGELDDDALRITELEAPDAGGDIDASGRIGFDGSLDAHVRAHIPDIGRDRNVQRGAPGAHGALDADLEITAEPGFEHPRYQGRVTLRGLRYGSVRAGRVTVRGRGSGGLPAPSVDVEGDAEGLHIGELALGEAHVTIRGGPEGYDVDARSQDASAGTRTAVRGRVTRRGDTWRLEAPELLVDLGNGAWEGHGDIRLRPGESVELAPLVLAQRDQRIVAEGTYRMHGDEELDVQAMNVDLADLRPLAPDRLEGIGGRLDGRLSLRGDVDRRPQGRLTANIREGTYGGLRGVSGRVDLALDGNTLRTDVRLDLGEAGELVAEGPIHVSPAALRDPARLVDEARFEALRVSAADFDLGPLLAIAGASGVELSGRITTQAELTGSLRRPGVREAVVILDRVVFQDWDPMRVKMHVTFLDDRLALRHVWLADSAGELLTGEADVPVPAEHLPRDLTGFWRLVRTQPWQLSVRLPQRRLDTWPTPIGDRAPRGLSTSASITASNEGGNITADFDAVARWMEAAVDAPCAEALRPLATVHGRLDGDVVTASVSGFFGGQRASSRRRSPGKQSAAKSRLAAW